MDTTFSATLFEWRGPAPFYWVALPPDACDYVDAQAAFATYGWGAIPVRVHIGATEWETSLLPRDGGYVLPVKKMVREREKLGDSDTVVVEMSVEPRDGRAANDSPPPRPCLPANCCVAEVPCAGARVAYRAASGRTKARGQRGQRHGAYGAYQSWQPLCRRAYRCPWCRVGGT